MCEVEERVCVCCTVRKEQLRGGGGGEVGGWGGRDGGREGGKGRMLSSAASLKASVCRQLGATELPNILRK